MESNKQTLLARCACSMGEIRNAIRMSFWILAWAVSWAGASQAIKREWLPSGMPTYLAIVLSTILGLSMMMGYLNYLRNSDELHRKIQLDALAVSLGLAVVGSATYRLLERAAVVDVADVSNVILLIAVGYSVTVLIGIRRYA